MTARSRRILYLLLGLAATFAVEADAEDPSSWPVRELPSRGYDVLHYRIELRLDPDRKVVDGVTAVTLSSTTRGLSRCVLDADSFSVIAVEDATRAEQLSFSHDQGRLVVELGRAYNTGEEVTLTITHTASDPWVEGSRAGLPEGYRLGLSFRDATADHPRMASTLSFPTGAHHWYPCFDHPSDRATQEVIVTVPAKWRALSNGRLAAMVATADGTKRRFHWSLELPHPTYLSMVAAGPYETIDDPVGELPMSYWVYPDDRETAGNAFSATPDIIRFLSRLYDFEFPWPKYDQVSVPGISGGAESTSATLIGQARIRAATLGGDDFDMAWLVAHEAAHQWWGNVVSYRDWGDTWLSESFATYSEHLFAAYANGPEEAAVDLIRKRDAYLEEAHSRYQRPIVSSRWRTPNDNFDRHTYEKGALVLHMLRGLLGDEIFFASLARFLDDHAFQAVVTADFIDTVRATSERDLDWFFEQWLDRPGHPVFEVNTQWSSATKRLTVNVAQVQDRANGTPIYRVPVSIGITTAIGTRTERVWLNAADQVLEFDCATEPLLVRFDRPNQLLMELTHRKGSRELAYQLTHDDVTGRMWAAEQLTAHPDDPGVVEALMKAASWDPFWAVRREAVRALAAIDARASLDTLRSASTDSSSEVRAAAVEAIGQTGETALVEFLQQRYQDDPSFLVKAAAVTAVGHCGGTSAAGFLSQAASVDSPRDIVRSAANAALDNLRMDSTAVH